MLEWFFTSRVSPYFRCGGWIYILGTELTYLEVEIQCVNSSDTYLNVAIIM